VRLTAVGQSVGGHAHAFDHTTIVLAGRVAMHTRDPATGEETDRVLGPGDHVLTLAAVLHSLTALDASCEFWCVYSHRDAQGRIAETFQGLGATR
jgi:quercetin dioxygenase-like cupin family protein